MNKLITIKQDLQWKGKTYELIYKDADSFDNLPYEKCTQCYGICFYKDKIVVGRRNQGHWGPIGGGIEKGELFEKTLKREVIEESNMKVLNFLPIGYQEVEKDGGSLIYQLRYVCEVEPIGKFEKDPDPAGITEIKFIDPKDYKKYFDWGKVGDRIMERANELHRLL